MKVCTKCNELKPIAAFHYHRGRRIRASSCKACNSITCLKYQTKKRSENDVKFLMVQRAGEIKRRATIAGVPVMAKGLGKYLVTLWHISEGLCYYTGKPMSFTGRSDDAVSVDRVVPEKGYVFGNVVLCRNVVNRVKQNLTVKELLTLCDEMKLHLKIGG